jgi:hypothetical protein
MSETAVHIILPEAGGDEISSGLRNLTRLLCRKLGADGSGGLGGEYGYGVNYSNHVFAMHRFCWCEREDCPWCSYSDEDGRHFRTKNVAHGAVEGLGGGAAPNFWHKPSGFRVWWYKWIGRGNETYGSPGDWKELLRECARSVPTPSPHMGDE